LPPDDLQQRQSEGLGRSITKEDWASIRTILLLAAVVVLFRVAYEQTGNTIALWIDERTDRVAQFGSWTVTIPATWFQSINPFLIFTLTPFLVMWWARGAVRGKQTPTIIKMALGCGFVAVAFVVMTAAAFSYQAAGAPVSWLWVATFLVLLTLGELFVIPVGLSLVTRLSPLGVAGSMIGVWYLAKFGGGLASGYFGTLWSSIPTPVFFLIGAGAAALSGAILFVLHGALPSIRRLDAPMAQPARATP
jgi:POT family proton-dependent oligopeptide transporter